MNKFLRGALVLYAICSLTAMAPMNLGFGVLLAAWIFSRSWTRSVNSPEFLTYRFWALALLITCWVSLAVAWLFPFSYADHAPEVTLHGFQKIWYLVIPFIVATAYEAGSDGETFSLATVIKPWWYATLALLAVAIIQFFTGWPQAQAIPTNPGRFHAILFFGHHLSTSSIIVFPAFTALAVAFGYFTRQRKHALPISPRFALAVGLAGFLILFLSYARTAWIALLLGVGILLQKYLGRHLTRKQWVAGFLGIALALGIFSQTTLVRERIVKAYGVSERFRLWEANLDYFKNRPITGIGWLKTQEMSEFYFKSIDPERYHSYQWGHAHNNFLEMLGGTGLLGLLAFLGWSFFTLRLGYRVSRSLEEAGNFFYADFALGILVALILLHFNGLTNVTFWEGKVMHQQMLGVGMLLILDRMRTKTAAK